MHSQESSQPIPQMTHSHSPLMFFWEQVIKFISLISLVTFVVGLFYKIGYLKTFQLTASEFPSPTELIFARGAATFIDYSNFDMIFIIPFILICITWSFAIKNKSINSTKSDNGLVFINITRLSSQHFRNYWDLSHKERPG